MKTPNIQTIEDIAAVLRERKCLWESGTIDCDYEGEVVPLITALITHAQERIEGAKHAPHYGQAHNLALDQANTILEALKTKV